MADTFWEMSFDGVGTVSIDYNPVNLRIGKIYFTVPTGVTCRVMLWNSGSLFYDNVYPEGSYSENVPGNFQVVMVDDEGVPHPTLPANISYYVAIRKT